MQNINEKREQFWNESLSYYESAALKNAGFRTPESKLDIPIFVMMNLNGFGYTCLQDLTAALIEYMDLPQEPFVNIAEKTEEYLLQMGYCRAEARMPKEEQMLLNIDEAFFLHGYDDEMIARLTFRELVCIPGVDYEIAEYMIKVVISKYADLYKQPKVILRTRDDIRQMTSLFFAEHK